jgi:type IV secretory system conjugative DNA transfer VirD4/TraG family protein
VSHSGGLWPLSTELLRWSRRDPWTLAQAVEGTLITGATGSGKTSGPFQYVMRALLRCGCGGLFLCAKQDAASDYLKLAKLEGRAGDVIHFSLASGQAFNFLTYEAQRHGTGKAIVENIVQVLMEAQEVISRKPGHQQGEDFFEGAMKQLLRNCLEVVIAATGHIDLTTVLEIVESLPQSSADLRTPEGLLALELLNEAEQKAPARAHELALARSYFTKAWPRLADRTRSSMAQTLSVLLDAFVRYPIHDLLLSGTTCSPDDVLAGKVVILDVPVKEFEHIGKVVGVIWKYCLQRAIESRVKAGHHNPDTLRPVFIAADEAQFWATKQDALFQQTARAARGVTVYASQSLANLYAELGGNPTGRAHVESLLGNLQTRLACQNSEPETNEWYARSIGRTKQYLTSWSFSPWAQLPKSKSKAEHIDYDVQPRKFTTLKSGGPGNNYLVEAILICAGRQFRANGQRWLRVTFQQNQEQSVWQWWRNGSVVRITAPRVS